MGWFYCMTCGRTLKRIEWMSLGMHYMYVCRGCDKEPKQCTCSPKEGKV